MKADKDDAPEYLKRKRSQSFGKWSLAIALGLGLSGLALHMAENQFLAKPQAGQTSYSENPTQTSNYNIPESEPKKTSEELFGKMLMRAIINRTSLSKLFITIAITGHKSRQTSTHRQQPIE
ncbi:hypothetical protein K9P43_27285 [Pseudomonas aeruginosa]|nr:hypothetical protein [Pseudomonas aeruginosa]HCI2493330.1 hypothetical protein [Pseudomonas aeruginosa]HCI2494955.1 hypothetical protein [Pseudomonas aeruginosa]